MGEKGLYTGDFSTPRVLIGEPRDKEPVLTTFSGGLPENMWTAAIEDPDNIDWRQNFANEVFKMFVNVAKRNSPLTLIKRDREWQDFVQSKDPATST